uniref:BPTI/Kunitz inhibitor domain-containing protein n=1 Tax=Caenorhabditis japonica TaxID=281687 RepID=A0A8R1ECJ8_CAEJA
MECALRRVECTSNPCPDVPFCVEVQCPIPQRDHYRNLIVCETDGGCGKNSKCVINPITELGVCCHQKPIQSSVLNLIAPAIVAAVPAPEVDTPQTTTISTRAPNSPVVVEAVPMSLATNCTTMRIALEYLHQNGANLNTPLPRCAKNGNYETTQCDNKRCWCVDELSGEEVHGTRKKKTKNACKSQSMCLSKCSATLCPYGLLLDDVGCPRSECICKSACEHVECANGQVCILRRADCPNKWCLPVPTCEKSPCNSGLWPLVETRTRQQYSCTQNTVCPIGYYCTAFDKNMHGVCCPGTDSIKSIGENDWMTCPHGDPFASSSDGIPHSCTVLANGCPATHYCSTMPGQNSGICCVSKRYVCNLQRDTGPCSATVSRFFYSSITHTCSSFDYGGCSGNLNNFATRDDCENFCAGIGLDLSSPYDHATAQMPDESYQLAFSLSGGEIPAAKRQDAEIQLINMLVDRFGIPRGSIEDVVIREKRLKFTIRDVDARRFSREISEKVSSGELSMTLAGQKVTAEPHTLTALHVSNEHGTRNTAQVVFYAILLASSIFLLCVICLFCFSCVSFGLDDSAKPINFLLQFCYYQSQAKDRAQTPSNTTSITQSRAGRQSELRRVFSRDDVSVCSDFNRPPPMHDVSVLNRDRHHNHARSQSWLSLG